jgi:hypothetical protein
MANVMDESKKPRGGRQAGRRETQGMLQMRGGRTERTKTDHKCPKPASERALS